MKRTYCLLALVALSAGQPVALAESPTQSLKWASDADRDTLAAYNFAADIYDETKSDPVIEGLWASLKVLGTDLGSGLDPKIHPGFWKDAVRTYYHTAIYSDNEAVTQAANIVLPNHPELQDQFNELEAWVAFLGECIDSESGNNRDHP